jgi:hypothetical protein
MPLGIGSAWVGLVGVVLGVAITGVLGVGAERRWQKREDAQHERDRIDREIARYRIWFAAVVQANEAYEAATLDAAVRVRGHNAPPDSRQGDDETNTALYLMIDASRGLRAELYRELVDVPDEISVAARGYASAVSPLPGDDDATAVLMPVLERRLAWEKVVAAHLSDLVMLRP